MLEDTQPAPLDDSGGRDQWSQFRVPNAEIRLALLRELRDGAVPLSVSSPCGAALRTAIWTLDQTKRRLSMNVEERNPQLPSLVQTNEAVAVAYLANVKLQFELNNLMLVRGHGSCTLQADLPTEIYRFQRRGSYRVRAPKRSSPSARMRHPAIPDMTLSLRVLDLSVGGCALWLPADVPLIQAGTLLGEVHIELDADTSFLSGLSVQHVSALSPGDDGVRLGCEWASLRGPAERMLQRWIDVAQRRTRLLSLG